MEIPIEEEMAEIAVLSDCIYCYNIMLSLGLLKTNLLFRHEGCLTHMGMKISDYVLSIFKYW